ncbi:AAA family ATPase [Bacillus cytotoxicus]|uniref:AAA family ATPase n=1 Tax=Bacillus cytotoxicus TaxID=580165 RepID=A0ACC6A305_9BACI|nr:AAA family ATPase [Bacillus cytotoxicus]
MRVENLHIYGYGKLENVQLNLSALTVLYGENEAGKSTIRSFMKSILFGFPTRGQRRYEPKEGGKYGGAITVYTEEYGRLKIERLPKTAAGEVTVYFADGKTGGEEVLKKLLNGMNEQLFDSVFSFDMHGLQNIHHIGEGDIGNYLFSASAVGSDGLMRLEKMLEKEMEQRFKPNGRKPEINVALQELKNLQDQLADWQGKIAVYEELVAKKKSMEERLSIIRTEQQEAGKRKQDYEVLEALQPLFFEKRACERFLEQHAGHRFPIDGLPRYEGIKVRLEPLQFQGEALQKKLAGAQSEIEAVHVNEELLQQDMYVEELRLQHMSYETAQQEVRDLTGRILHIEEEIQDLQQQIGSAFAREDVLSFNVSLAMKETITQMVQQAKELEKRKGQLDERFKTAQEQLEEQEETVKKLQSQTLPDRERERYLPKVQSAASRQSRNRTASPMNKAAMVVFIMDILLLLAGVFMDSRKLLFAGVFLLIGLVIFYVMYSKGSVEQESDEALEFKYRLEKDDEVRKLLEREEFKLKQIERGYDRILSEYDEWERDLFSVNEQVKLHKETYALPHSFTYAHILPAFERIEKMQQLYRELAKQQERKVLQEDMISQFEHKLMKLTIVTERSVETPSLFLYGLSKDVQKEKEKQLQKKQMLEKIAAWEEEYAAVYQQMQHLVEERQQLWEIAAATDEEAFLIAAKQAEQIDEKKQQLDRLIPQMDILEGRLMTSALESGYRLEGYEEERKKEQEQIDELMREEKELTQTIASLRHDIAQLEEGRTYGDVLHEWELKKSQVREQVKKWAAYAAAKAVLAKTKKYYHEVQLPRILQKAEEYFIYLTGGNYVKVFSPSAEEPFIVERQDGLCFYSHELSQATAEQLYLSLRFALAHTFEGQYPFIIDDSFVHFDVLRTERTVHLMKELAKERQVIFFTCHKHLLSFFAEGEVQMLKR